MNEICKPDSTLFRIKLEDLDITVMEISVLKFGVEIMPNSRLKLQTICAISEIIQFLIRSEWTYFIINTY